MPPRSFQTVQELELNAWPDIEGIYRNGWRVRLSGGFTGRANSVTALAAGANLSDADLDGIEAICLDHGIRPMVRITEFVDGETETRLEQRGYMHANASEFQSAALDMGGAVDPSVELLEHPTPNWIEAFGQINGRPDFKAETMAAIVDRIVLPVRFARLIEDGLVRAVGMAVVDRGLMEVQSIAVDTSCRNRGLGRRMVSSLLAWGHSAGAGEAILSVLSTNVPAIRLYEGLGFAKFGQYHYRVKPA